MNVIACDPGKATGLAFMYGESFSSHIMPWYDSMAVIESHLAAKNIDLIVIEDYRISRNTLTKGADAHWAMGGIGIVTYLAQKHGVKAIKYSPSEAKSFSTDSKLKKLDWYKTGDGHDNDAARHLLLALVNEKMFDLRRLL